MMDVAIATSLLRQAIFLGGRLTCVLTLCEKKQQNASQLAKRQWKGQEESTTKSPTCQCVHPAFSVLS